MNLSELSTFNSFLITTFESWFICAKSPAIHKKFNLEFCKIFENFTLSVLLNNVLVKLHLESLRLDNEE